VYRTEIKAKTSFSWGRYFKYPNFKYPYSFTNLFWSFVLTRYSYWNLGKLLLLCAHPLMISIIFHIRGTTNQENVSYIRDFYVSSDVLFSRFEELKITFFHIHPIRSRSYELKSFGCLEVSNRVCNLNKR